MYRVDWIEWQGNKYCVDDVVLYGFENEKPKFGKINGIITLMSQIFFALNAYVTIGTDRHHNSILIEKSAELFLVHLTEDSILMGKQHSFETHVLRSYRPGIYHIVTKYFLFNLN